MKPVRLASHASELIFLEVFAGNGNLSESIRSLGLTVHAIDSITKRRTGVSIHVLDLTSDSDLAILLDIVSLANVASAHVAPPCGTSSKAREKLLPEGMQSVKVEPLRSQQRTFGLRGLQGTDAKWVAAANKLYAATLCLIVILVIRGAAVSVENPRNSYFWQIMETLVDNISQACMYGSKHDKWTTIRATDGLHNDIRKECDGKHSHESWKPTLRHSKVNFPTTAQSEYPRGLCEEMSRCVAKFLTKEGTIFSDTNLAVDATLAARHLRHHAATSGRVLGNCRWNNLQTVFTYKTLEQIASNYGKRGWSDSECGWQPATTMWGARTTILGAARNSDQGDMWV